MRNVKNYLLLFLFLAIIAPFSWAYPDLEVYEILFSTEYPNKNDEFTISAIVHNSSDSYSDPVFTENPEPIVQYRYIYNAEWHAQSFKCSEEVNLTGVSLFIRDIGDDDSLTVTIETNTVDNLPSGVEIASTTVNSDVGGWSWFDCMFSSVVPLSANITYWIVAQNSTGLIDDGYSIALTSYNNYANGIEAYSYDRGDPWAEWPTRDLLFKAYRSTTTIVEFYDGDPDSGCPLIGTDEISPVPEDGSITASILTSFSAGYHNIYVRVNPYNYIVEEVTTNNEGCRPIAVDCPRILTAQTVDDDLNGRIDAYHIIFNEAINDSTLVQTSTCGFSVQDYSGLKVLISLDNHFDVVNDTDIYLCFTEGSPDTDIVPEITYSSSTGKLKDLASTLLLDVSTSTVVEQDGAAPIIYFAEAPDYSGENPGIESGDRVVIKFSESVSGPPNINSTNIDEVLITTGTFKDGDGFIGSAVWSDTDKTLTISLSVSRGSPNIFPGYTITTDTFTFKDSSGNVSSHTIVLWGNFDTTSPMIVSTSPEDKEKGLPIDASIQINFSERMNATNTKEAISIKEIKDKDGKDITPKAVTGLPSYNLDTFCLTFTPESNLKNNSTYKVTISQIATDLIGHHLALSEFSFTTISNYKESNTFVSDDSKMKITLDEGTLKEDFFVEISTSPLKDSPKRTNIINANNKLDIDDDPFSFTLKPTLVEIKAFDANGNPITHTFEIPATITLSYEDSNPEDGFVDVDGTAPQLREETLKVYWLNESHSLWVKLANSVVDNQSNIVTARTFHFSIFSLHGVGATDLSDAYAYPVPFIPSRGDKEITFKDISPLCTIKIYTLNGELVSTIEHTSGKTIHPWDATNDRGDRLGSGVYLYLIQNGKNKKKGKLIIIR